MISDTIDDALDNDEAEEETEELTNQVSFSIYLSINKLFLKSEANFVRASIDGCIGVHTFMIVWVELYTMQAQSVPYYQTSYHHGLNRHPDPTTLPSPVQPISMSGTISHN